MEHFDNTCELGKSFEGKVRFLSQWQISIPFSDNLSEFFVLKNGFCFSPFSPTPDSPRRRITNCFPWKAVKWWADAINLFSGLSLVFFFVTFVVFQVLAFWASVSLIICEQEPWNDTAKPHSVKVALQNRSQNRSASVPFILNWREWQFFCSRAGKWQ